MHVRCTLTEREREREEKTGKRKMAIFEFVEHFDEKRLAHNIFISEYKSNTQQNMINIPRFAYTTPNTQTEMSYRWTTNSNELN